jgi:hypothetical protein
LPDFAKLNEFEDRERPGTEIKEYQIKYADRKHVKEYQEAAKTINVAAKCIRGDFLRARGRSNIKMKALKVEKQLKTH